MKNKPVPPLTVLRVDLRQSEHAIYPTVVMQDAKGDIYHHRSSSFLFDLEEGDPKSNES